MNFSDEIIQKIEQLSQKYAAIGQDLNAYLEGLLQSKSLDYWDYIQLETLLSLQKPRTHHPDEIIFITYHQITELYFKLILHELQQILSKDNHIDFLLDRLTRVNNYFKHLIHSFEIMINGMEKEQFLKFRMALLPASGFQSVQYRMIEIHCTQLKNLVKYEVRNDFINQSLEEQYQNLYWKFGNLELSTGKKTLTLQIFENKYDKQLYQLAFMLEKNNLNFLLEKMIGNQSITPGLIDAFKELDLNANVYWCLSHYKSAVRYLQQDPEVIKATGGTNWQKYLPPKHQNIQFFPILWSDEEKQNWGKNEFLSTYKPFWE